MLCCLLEQHGRSAESALKGTSSRRCQEQSTTARPFASIRSLSSRDTHACRQGVPVGSVGVCGAHAQQGLGT